LERIDSLHRMSEKLSLIASQSMETSETLRTSTRESVQAGYQAILSASQRGKAGPLCGVCSHGTSRITVDRSSADESAARVVQSHLAKGEATVTKCAELQASLMKHSGSSVEGVRRQTDSLLEAVTESADRMETELDTQQTHLIAVAHAVAAEAEQTTVALAGFIRQQMEVNARALHARTRVYGQRDDGPVDRRRRRQ
jgi:hypothetical protein